MDAPRVMRTSISAPCPEDWPARHPGLGQTVAQTEPSPQLHFLLSSISLEAAQFNYDGDKPASQNLYSCQRTLAQNVGVGGRFNTGYFHGQLTHFACL